MSTVNAIVIQQATPTVSVNATDPKVIIANLPALPGPAGAGLSNTLAQVVPYGLATGIISRGVISVNASDPTKIDISAGKSLYVDNSDPLNPVVDILSWADQTAITPPDLITQGRLWIGIQRTAPQVGTFVYSTEFTAAEKRTIATLGRVWCNGTTTVEGIGQYAEPAWGYEKTLVDLMHALGSINMSGNHFHALAGGLTLGKSSGESFRFSAASGLNIDAPNVLTDLAQPTITAYHYHVAQGSGFTTLKTTVDPNNYDLGGVLTAVPTDKYTLQRVYYFPRSGVVDLTYGQAVYDSLNEAIGAANTEQVVINSANDTTLAGSILRAWVAVKQGCSDISDTTIASVIVANGAIGGGSSGIQTLPYHAHQAGIEGEPAITDNGDGTVSVAEGEAWFYTDSTREDLVFKTISATLNLTPTHGATAYICADRDTSAWTIRSDFDLLRYIPYFILFERVGSNSEHSQHIGLKAHGEVESIYMRTFECDRYARAYGLDQVSVDGTLHITSNSGRIYSVNHAYDLLGVTSATRQFWCTQAGVYSSNANPVIDNTQYDDGSSLQTLNTDYWVNIFLFRGVEEQDHCYTLRSGEFASVEEAKASNTIGTIPDLISSHAVLIARITVQQGQLVDPLNIQSAFATTFNAASSVGDPNRNRKITIGTAAPSGGSEGDLYIQYSA